jgi:hypothetical protein
VNSLIAETRHGKRSHRADLEWKYLLPSLEYVSKDSTHRISFEWAPEMGTPGAVLVTNNHSQEFFLKELSIEIPGKGDIRFLCNSWIYPKWMTTFCSNLTAERVFFANNVHLFITSFLIMSVVQTLSGLLNES